MFEVITGNEPYQVIDLSNGGISYFRDKLDAYKWMAILKSRGHYYHLIVKEVSSNVKQI